MGTATSSVWRDGDPHHYACYEGWGYLTYTVFDEDVGDKVEKMEVDLCRRCAERACGARIHTSIQAGTNGLTK